MSSYLYGNPEVLPILETAPLSATNPYALSKKLTEDCCEFYSNSFGIGVTIFRLFNVFGPGQSKNFLLQSIIEQIDKGGSIEVKDLEPKRDYIYIADVVDAIIHAVDCRERLNIFNLGSGISYSVEEMINIVQELRQTNLPVFSSGQRRKDEIMDTVADISKAKQHFGWSPQYSLSDGIRQFLNEGQCNKLC